ncbi:MAG: helix-turn-helix domain-containing protein [Spirochaetales bacterium]|nr:helix-turn-helix domain-containing protein [Spirochaetales bacterium]
MKLLFFIRIIDVKTRHLGAESGVADKHHELIFCFEGSGYMETGNTRYGIKKGDLLFNPAGTLSRLRRGEGKELKIGQIIFDESLFSSNINMEREALYVLGLIKLYTRKENTIRLSGIGSERIGKLYESMAWEFRNRSRGYSWAIRLKLIELLITVMRDKHFRIPVKQDIAKPLSSNRIQDVLNYLNADYMNVITVEDILQFCPMSRSHFHALFKRETGKTLVEYLNELRVIKAGELLVSTDDTILEIAVKCGFTTQSYFCNTFKKIKGMSPKDFRKNLGRTEPAGVLASP